MTFPSVEEARIRTAYERRAASDERYSWFDPGQLLRLQQLERKILTTVLRHGLAPLESRKILEIGCGGGYWLRQFIQWGARPENVAGVDLIETRVADAQRLCPPQVEVQQGNAARLTFAEKTFDLVFQATVFTSIFDATLKSQIAAEMLRVTKDNGLVLWYDFRVDNPWNPEVRGVRRSEIERLFSGCRVMLQRVTLAPPVARRLAPYSWLGCLLLEKIPGFCTHYLGAIQKHSQP
jgi:ubiquinone/menaquinone biosynthesis C-methylase UbiE